MHDLALLDATPGTAERTRGLVLQRLPLGRDVSLRDLYVRAVGRKTCFPVLCRADQDGLIAQGGARLSFDTYFGAFFEQLWRGATTLRSVTLDLQVQGSFALRVLRRSAEGEEVLLHERRAEDVSGRLSIAIPMPVVPAAAGRLFAELTALPGGCRIEALEWRTPDTPILSPVGLVPVFCTFGREWQLGAMLRTLAAERSCWEPLPRLIVVNQGQPGLADHPALAALPDGFAARLRIIEQGNFGGAGGFTRGLLAARKEQGATHALLMDDDVAAEPEALRRAAAFFAIARPRQALGGHMLDMLRPTHLYEAGARIDPQKLYLRPLRHDLPLARRRTLDALTRPEPMHYNGWWFFGLPLALLAETGLPLPCFIRGDDVEYGLRLGALGATTVALPGAAIWHEPFYVKLNGWQLYYETRNMLVAAAQHMPRSAPSLAVLLLKRLLLYLLTYRYYSAALVLRAIEDFLVGPALYEADPRAVHAALDVIKAKYPPEPSGRDRVIADGRLRRDPRTRPGFALALARAVLRNWVLPSGTVAPVRIGVPDLVWFRVLTLDHLVVESRWDPHPLVFRRSRPAFRQLFTRGLRVLHRFLRDGGTVSGAWREAHPNLTSDGFWNRYLLGRRPTSQL